MADTCDRCYRPMARAHDELTPSTCWEAAHDELTPSTCWEAALDARIDDDASRRAWQDVADDCAVARDLWLTQRIVELEAVVEAVRQACKPAEHVRFCYNIESKGDDWCLCGGRHGVVDTHNRAMRKIATLLPQRRRTLDETTQEQPHLQELRTCDGRAPLQRPRRRPCFLQAAFRAGRANALRSCSIHSV